MKKKYYYPEHESAYRQIEYEGKTAWDELHGSTGFDHFAGRNFLERALAELRLPPAQTDVWEYGCGTGPASCFLAERGFAVDACDVVPQAISLARRISSRRGLKVNFQVQDICALADVPSHKRYDLVVDSYCLQSIVLDEDRVKLFAAVRARLKTDGFYVISTAMYEPDRHYGEGLFDEQSGVVYSRLGGGADRFQDIDGAVLIGESWYLPHRRHLKADALARELERAGFRLLYQGGPCGGEIICTADALTTGA